MCAALYMLYNAKKNKRLLFSFSSSKWQILSEFGCKARQVKPKYNKESSNTKTASPPPLPSMTFLGEAAPAESQPVPPGRAVEQPGSLWKGGALQKRALFLYIPLTSSKVHVCFQEIITDLCD